METFVGLDVSLGETTVCILDKDGTRIFEGKVASKPALIARLIRKRAPGVVRVGLESGPTSVWLTHTLTAEGLPVVCLDARHAQAVLSVQLNKSDRGDARGLAEMIRVGWFKAVQVKSLNAHERKALLIARHQLVDMRSHRQPTARYPEDVRFGDWQMWPRAHRTAGAGAVQGATGNRWCCCLYGGSA